MKIDFSCIAVITELRSMKSLIETEIVRVTEVVETIMVVLTPEKWLFEVVTVLNLIDTTLAAATI